MAMGRPKSVTDEQFIEAFNNYPNIGMVAASLNIASVTAYKYAQRLELRQKRQNKRLQAESDITTYLTPGESRKLGELNKVLKKYPSQNTPLPKNLTMFHAKLFFEYRGPLSSINYQAKYDLTAPSIKQRLMIASFYFCQTSHEDWHPKLAVFCPSHHDRQVYNDYLTPRKPKEIKFIHALSEDPALFDDPDQLAKVTNLFKVDAMDYVQQCYNHMAGAPVIGSFKREVQVITKQNPNGNPDVNFNPDDLLEEMIEDE